MLFVQKNGIIPGVIEMNEDKRTDLSRQLSVDISNLVRLLESNAYTCVLCNGDRVFTTRLRGVTPLVQWLQEGAIPAGFSAADKVVGKATAFLYCLLGAKAVYARVMSRGAKTVLENNGIYAQYSTLTDYIENRKKDGMCPFETAVMDIDAPEQALTAIYETMKALGIPFAEKAVMPVCPEEKDG